MKVDRNEFMAVARAHGKRTSRKAAAGPKPKPHQKSAVAAVVATLGRSDRAKVLMACGTGKSLVGMWSAQALDPWRVLVLVPTLALLKQTRDIWLQEGNAAGWQGELRTLCVCSDVSVAGQAGSGDDMVDLGIPVTTEPAEIAAFLKASDQQGAVAVVFTTYASAWAVGQAIEQQPRLGGFDVGIFDEAHKTVGEEGKPFAFAMSDARLPIRKRIFYTATPRVLAAGAGYSVSSMDDVASYGPTAYELGFKQAVAAGLIAPYRIIISVIDDSLVSSDEIEGDQSMPANQHVLRQAMASYGLSKALTFHRSVLAAKRFAQTFGAAPDAAGIDTFHVSGMQTMAVRDQTMQRFRDAQRAIVTNARCLTEGVDVPAVDLVAFVDSRRSKVDIVQAIGRTLRLSPGKTHGHVLLPLHLNVAKGETVEAALERTDLAPIMEVLSALFENDADLHDLFATNFLQSIAKDKDSGDSADELFSMRGSNEVGNDLAAIEFHLTGKRIDAPALSKRLFNALKTRILGSALGGFYDAIGDYVRFKLEHGREPSQSCETERELKIARWATRTRCTLNDAETSNPRVAALNKAGFKWDRIQWIDWDEVFDNFTGFIAKHGELPKRTGVRPDEDRLYKWLSFQRGQHRKGKLSQERFDRLATVPGTQVEHENLRDMRWNGHYQDYMDFVRAEGRHPARTKKGPRTRERMLAEWAYLQTRERLGGRLTAQREAKLEAIPGFTWTEREKLTQAWHERLEELRLFVMSHGRRPHGQSGDPAELSLTAWMNNARRGIYQVDVDNPRALVEEALKGAKRKEVVRLTADESWARLAQLEAFVQEHGRRPERASKDLAEKQLMGWAIAERQAVYKDADGRQHERIARIRAILASIPKRTRDYTCKAA